MRKNSGFRWLVISALLLGAGWLFHAPAVAEETLRYSSSAQVREAFGMDGLNAFKEESGVALDLFVGSSSAAIHRLMNGFADIASTVERLQFSHRDYGYVEIPFCKAPLIVISNVKTPVRNISSEQLRAVFNGTITNWKELGGPDQEIIVVVPEKNTGAYKNFRQLALKRFDVKYDFMAYRSTDVVKLVHRIPWSISFISQGANTVNEAIRIIQIDGRSPGEPNYPYYQIFSFVTKGQPAGAAKKLIDFAFSDRGRSIMKKNGMEPIDS
ncbi:MAG: substrate-binding domain-containing protein [Desulfobacterales bacterium]|nr:MAG: substrate-binding domain-containing protein [Desulfobacterales bacterium]